MNWFETKHCLIGRLISRRLSSFSATTPPALFVLSMLFVCPAQAVWLPVQSEFAYYYTLQGSAFDGTAYSTPVAACTALSRPFVPNGTDVSDTRMSREGLGLSIGNCVHEDSWVQPDVMPIFVCPAWAIVYFGQCYMATCPIDGNCKEPSRCSEANPQTPYPISIGTGGKFLSEVDLPANNRGMGFTRHYRSNSILSLKAWNFTQGGLRDSPAQAAIGRFGAGWRHSHQSSLQFAFNTAAVWAIRPAGQVIVFSSANGLWTTDADVNMTLKEIIHNQERLGWHLVDLDVGQIEVYDLQGRIVSRHEVNGNSLSYIYSDGTDGVASGNGGYLVNADGSSGNEAMPSGLLMMVRDAGGRTMRFQYDASLRLVGIVDSSMWRTGYSYTGGADCGALECMGLAAVDFPDQVTRQYLYNELNLVSGTPKGLLLTGIVDENANRFATYAYDTEGRAISSEHSGGVQKYQLSFGAGNTVVIDPLGTQRGYNFTTVQSVAKKTGQTQPSASGCGPASTAVSYDANGNMVSRTDYAGHRTCYAKDLGRNLEIKRVEGINSSVACSTALVMPPAPTTADPVRVISTQWHPDWRLETSRAEPKKLTRWIYHGQPDPTAGNAVAACAPADALLPDGKPIAVLCKKIEQATSDPTGGQGFAAPAEGSARSWTYTYNRHGQILTATDPRGNTTSHTYYPDTTPDHTLGDVATTTNAAGHVTTYPRYDRNGRLLEMRDPNGVATRFTYDPRGRLTSHGVGGETTTYAYDPVGQLTRVTFPGGHWIGYQYDPAHRLTGIEDPLGNRIAYTLDPAGNRIREDITDPDGTLVKSLSRAYDALGRLQTLTGVAAE